MWAPSSTRRPWRLIGVVCVALTAAACGSSGQAATPPKKPLSSLSSQMPAPSSTLPDSVAEYGTCQVMGSSVDGSEIFLELHSVLGAGDYFITYALRDKSGTILEIVTREISLNEEEVLAYWDSLPSGSKAIVTCDIRSVENGPEICTAGHGCTILTAPSSAIHI